MPKLQLYSTTNTLKSEKIEKAIKKALLSLGRPTSNNAFFQRTYGFNADKNSVRTRISRELVAVKTIFPDIIASLKIIKGHHCAEEYTKWVIGWKFGSWAGSRASTQFLNNCVKKSHLAAF